MNFWQYTSQLFTSTFLVFSLIAPVSAQSTTATPQGLSPELKQCLVTAAGGEDNFAAIASGSTEPDAALVARADKDCFEKFGAPIKRDTNLPDPVSTLAGPTRDCIGKVVGADNVDKLVRAQLTISTDVRSQTQKCFGQRPTKVNRLDSDLEKCLISSMGEATFDAVGTGLRPPTQEEQDKGKACFDKHGAPSFGSPGGPQGQPPDPKTEACVVGILGSNFRDLKAPPTPEQNKRMRDECFHGGPGGPDGHQLSPELQKCLTDKGIDFQAGPPSPEKMKSGEECFKQFGAPFGPGQGGPGGPGGQEPPAEVRACIQKVLGVDDFRKLSGPPTKDQEQQLRTECFKGGPQGGPGGPPQLSAELENCLLEKGIDVKAAPPTPEKMKEGEECFRKHGTPFGGPNGGPGGPGGPQGQEPPAEVKACISEVLGVDDFRKLSGPPSEDQRKQLNEKCFKGGPQGGPNGPQGGPQGQQASPEQQACVQKIAGSTPPTEEQQKKIGQECFAGQGGPNGQSGPNGQLGGPPPGGAEAEQCQKDKLGGKTVRELGRAPSSDEQKSLQDCFKGAAGQAPNQGNQGPNGIQAPPAGRDNGNAPGAFGPRPDGQGPPQGQQDFRNQQGPPPGGGNNGQGNLKPAGEDCGRKTLGDKFEQVKSGSYRPSSEEMDKINQCLGAK